MALRLRSALLVAFLFATAMGYYHFKIFLPRAQTAYAARGMGNGYFFGDDFYPIWLTSREWRLHRVDPYSPAMTQAIQIGLFGRPLDAANPDARNPNDPPGNYREFSYPAFVDILALPSTWFSFPAVRIAGALILLLMTVAGAILWMQVLDFPVSPGLWAIVILLTLFSYPVLEGIAAVQVGLAVGFLLPFSLAMLKKGWKWPAGLFLALTTIKPQMPLLVIGCLLLWSLSEWRRHWEFAAGLIGGLTLVCISAELHLHFVGGRVATHPSRIRSLFTTAATDSSLWNLSGQSIQPSFTRCSGRTRLAHATRIREVSRIHTNDCERACNWRGCATPGASSL